MSAPTYRTVEVDSVLRLLSGPRWPGPYQLFLGLCLCLHNVITALNHLLLILIAAPVPHRCSTLSLTTDDSCSVPINSSSDNNATEPCTAWLYSPPTPRERGLVEEFDLVCRDAYLKNVSATVYFCGVMLGGVIFGWLSDRLGRRPLLLTALYLQVAFGVGVAFSNSFLLFTILRFFMGILLQVAVRWLMTRGQLDKAQENLKFLSKRNGKQLPADPLGRKASVQLVSGGEQAEPGGERAYSLLDMCRTPRLRRSSLALCYIWCVVTCGYYGLSFQLTSVGSNKYMTVLIAGLCELPAYCAAVFIITRFGRLRPLAVYLAVGSVACIASAVVTELTRLAWLSTALSLLGRCSMAGCFSILFLYSSEVFPTVIRNVSVGVCGFWSRVGGMLAPQVLLLGKLTYGPVPPVIFGAMSFFGVFLISLLPETRDTKMPETISDAEMRGKQGAPPDTTPTAGTEMTEKCMNGVSHDHSTTGAGQENESVDV